MELTQGLKDLISEALNTYEYETKEWEITQDDLEYLLENDEYIRILIEDYQKEN